MDCVCDDAKNNTFSCVRRIKLDETGTNVTDNLVYCEFVDSENFIEGILFHCTKSLLTILALLEGRY